MRNKNVMPESFFQPGEAKDPVYTNMRDKSLPDSTGSRDHRDPDAEEAHEFIESLWAEYAPYADSHFLSEAKNQFHPRFWEMYLCVALIRKGFQPVKVSDEGPEFYFIVGDKKVWIEAITPGPGTGPDAVPELQHGVIRDVHQYIIPRYTHALYEKLKKYKEAVKKGIVGVNDCYVVALNCADVPFASLGFTQPYIVHAFTGVGDLALVIDTQTKEVVNRYHQFREQVAKQNGSPVNTAPFLDFEYAGISGVLHSGISALNHTQRMGDDFEFLHNPLASQPIDHSVFSFYRQYVYSPEHGNLQKIEPKGTKGD